jgi:hypothetical protein
MDELDSQLRESGRDPSLYNQDEKGAIWELHKKTEQEIIQMLSYFFQSTAEIKKLLEERDFEAIVNVVNAECEHAKQFDSQRREVIDLINNFRTKANNYLVEINRINRNAQNRAGLAVEFSTNVDDINEPGSRAWLLDKIFFDLCNGALDIVDPMPK